MYDPAKASKVSFCFLNAYPVYKLRGLGSLLNDLTSNDKIEKMAEKNIHTPTTTVARECELNDSLEKSIESITPENETTMIALLSNDLTESNWSFSLSFVSWNIMIRLRSLSFVVLFSLTMISVYLGIPL